MSVRVLIVSGEQGSGKSRLSEPLTRCYGLQHVVDGWDGRSPSMKALMGKPGGCLVMTNADYPRVEAPGVVHMGVDEAKALVARCEVA
ncbi:hypothetical protein LG302_00910 [Halomonas organivorans]